uniref:YacA protein n=1 Tax=Bartonella schoenbuchensis TaxID=165694 RepID=A0A024LRC8_9HYPH|nr:YacA protein [Bartonella schoenbuchensis]
MAETTFTFRVDDVLKNEFSKVAKAFDRSGAQLLRDYMRDIVKEQKEKSAYNLWFREQVQFGINSANAGHIISSEEIEAEAKEWRLKTQSKLDRSTL